MSSSSSDDEPNPGPGPPPTPPPPPPTSLRVSRVLFSPLPSHFPPHSNSNYATSAQPNYALPALTRTRTRQLKRHAKLLVALAEAGVEWVAGCLVDGSVVSYGSSHAGYASNAAYAHGSHSGQGGTQGGVLRLTLAQTLLRVVLALTAVDPGGARVWLTRSSHSCSFRGGGAGSFGGSGSVGHGQGDVDDSDGEGEDEDDEDDEDEDQPSGAPLYFWYLLWEVPVNDILDDTIRTRRPQTRTSSPPSPPPLLPFLPPPPHRPPPEKWTQTTRTSSAAAWVGGGGGGTPRTPGVVRSGSYAFASPSPIVSPMGPMGQALFAHSTSFGFPPSSTSSSSAFPTSASHANAGENVGEMEREMEQEMEREKRETEREREEMTAEKARTAHARAAYVALVRILRGTVVCGRGRDRLERFAVYRRDVGDTLINAYYILWDDLLVFLVAEAEAAAAGVERVRGMWEVRAPATCMRAKLPGARARLRVDRNVRVRRASWDAGNAAVVGAGRLLAGTGLFPPAPTVLCGRNALPALPHPLIPILPTIHSCCRIPRSRLHSHVRLPTDARSHLHCLRAVHEALDLDSTPTFTSGSTTGDEGRGLAATRRGRRSASGTATEVDGVGACRTCSARLRMWIGDLFGGMWWSGLAGELGITNGFRLCTGGLGSASSLSLASLLLVNLLTTVPWFLQAALALRSLCDANRRALASRIDAFAEVHAGLGGVPDSEKGKVLQSIASVIQALPPAEAVAPVEAMVGPILQTGAGVGCGGAWCKPACRPPVVVPTLKDHFAKLAWLNEGNIPAYAWDWPFAHVGSATTKAIRFIAGPNPHMNDKVKIENKANLSRRPNSTK
ncbi:hypothetical protein B0H13DRAFT_2271229 [Mycena leptocephala]|nr:hypothetical protein B0H13DRAFT_2271229 [Mycena leptocephala]